MRLGRLSIFALVPVVLVACGGSGSNATGSVAPAACITTAHDDRGTVAAAFFSTVGAIRRLPAVDNNPQLAGYADGQPATVCYIDGQIPKGPGPPDDPSATIPLSFDRAVLVIVGQNAIFIAAGYRQDLLIQAP